MAFSKFACLCLVNTEYSKLIYSYVLLWFANSPPVPPEQPSHPSSAKSGEPEPTEELRAFNDPYAAYTEAMKMISKEQW